MLINRVMGLENEYGLTSTKNTDPIILSNRIVSAYAKHVYPNSSIRWDYDLENPLRDARGYDLTRAEADVSLLTHEDQTIANLVIPNGARFYVDHAHPEYSSPEVISPIDIALWDLAGEKVMQKACELDALENSDDEIRIFKNNVDNKGASYGTHENYMTTREVKFENIINGLTSHLVTRQIYCGAGRIGIGQNSEISGYQISQRADYIETHVGLETTLRRPIINTRDEPHCDPALYRRLHLIIGDANMSDNINILKTGTTSIILSMIEANYCDFSIVEIENPVAEVKNVSQDLDLNQKIKLKNGHSKTALEIQEWYFEKALEFCQKNDFMNDYQVVLEIWQRILNSLNRDKSQLIGEVDWITKLNIIEKYMTKHNTKLDDLLLKSLDIKYSEITKDDGIAQILRKNSILITKFSKVQIDNAVLNPPTQTRAWFRGKVLSKFSNNIAAASWDSVIFDVDAQDPLVRISTLDPLKGNKDLTGELIDNAKNITDLLGELKKKPQVN
jgi:proteasome accessory factor A